MNSDEFGDYKLYKNGTLAVHSDRHIILDWQRFSTPLMLWKAVQGRAVQGNAEACSAVYHSVGVIGRVEHGLARFSM
jgi:hypothetical protein